MDLRVNMNKIWTEDDFKLLADLWNENADLEHMCLALGRSASGVCAQLANRGYVFYSRQQGAYLVTQAFATNREMVQLDKKLAGEE